MAITSTPRNVNLGVDDQSSLPEPAEDVRIPQHCPIFNMYTERAMGERAFVSARQARTLFGKNIFNPKFDGYSNVSRYAALAFGNANNSVIQSIIPTGADISRANVLVALDKVPVTYTPYLRNSDGSFAKDVNGDYVDDPNADDIDGFASRLVYTNITNDDCTMDNTCASFTKSAITWDGDAGERIPLFVVSAAYFGAVYNEYGITVAKSATEKDDLWEQRGYDFGFGLVRKVKGNPVKQSTNLSGKTFKASLVNSSRDEATGMRYFIQDRMAEMYARRYGGKDILEYDVVKVFGDYIDEILLDISTKEKLSIDVNEKTFADGIDAYETDWFDYDVDKSFVENMDILDLLFMTSSTDVSYKSRNLADYEDIMMEDLNGYNLFIPSGSSPIFMDGGRNGYISDQTLRNTPEDLCDNLSVEVLPYIMEYADIASGVQNTALNPESNLYDPGYTMETKLALIDFISLRKDTAINFTTEIEGEGPIDDSIRLARLITIDNAMKLAPESDYYGTTTFRYTISYGLGEKVKEVVKTPLGQNFEQLEKLSRYMGAGNGLWKTGEAYDTWPASRVNTLVNLTPKEVPPLIRDKVWASNAIFTDPKNMEEHFITAMQTGYDDELSVLNGTLVLQACLTIEKYNDDVWREVSGAERLTKPRLKERVEKLMNDRIKDSFDNSFIIYPEVYFTKNDLTRNYAWHLNVHLGAAGMHTRQVSTITTHRIEDLEGGN